MRRYKEKKIKFRSIGIAVAMLCTLLLGIQNSDAAKIVEFPSDTEDYSYSSYGGATFHVASLKTDVPYSAVDWYLGDPDDPNDWKGQETENGDGVKTTSSFRPYDKIPGSLQGKTYHISARVWFWVDGASSDEIKTYKVRMFQPLTVASDKQETGVSGYVELTRHYFDGWSINVDGIVRVFNGTAKTCNTRSWFRHTEYESDARNAKPTGWEEQHPPFKAPNPGTLVDPGESYSRSGSSSISYFIGGPIRDGKFYYLNPHIHLEVSNNEATDVWHELGTMINTFGVSDNP